MAGKLALVSRIALLALLALLIVIPLRSTLNTRAPQSLATPAAPKPTVTPTIAAGSFVPIDTAACGDLTAKLAAAFTARVTASQATFRDIPSGAMGVGCLVTAGATGTTIKDVDYARQQTEAILKARGWSEDKTYTITNPTSFFAIYRQGQQVCQVSISWQPSPDVECPKDKPLSDCPLKPEQKLFVVTLHLAERKQP